MRGFDASAMKQPDPPEPPQPPPFQRRIRISGLQTMGVGLLVLLPLAALTGLVTPETHESRASAGPLELTVRYPARMYYSTFEALELGLKNTGSHALSSARVQLPTDYLSNFDNVLIRPHVQHLSEARAQIDLGELAPGQTRKLVVEVRASDYGRHDGRISAAAGDAASVALEVSTLVLP